MSRRMTRREMIRSGALAGAGFWIGAGAAEARRRSPNEKLNIACIGVGGRGLSNVNGMAGENLVALCDVDGKRADAAYRKYPGTKKYQDFRRMFDELEKQIDAVVVSTPDHTHFHPALRTLQAGKHLYCEKPLAHSVWEVRTLTRLAREKKVATQLGTQHHSKESMRRVVELVRSGAIGEIREVHAWKSATAGCRTSRRTSPPCPNT